VVKSAAIGCLPSAKVERPPDRRANRERKRASPRRIDRIQSHDAMRSILNRIAPAPAGYSAGAYRLRDPLRWTPECLIKRETASRNKENKMNWDQIEGKWKQLAGSVQERWGKLTDDEVQMLTGQKDQLAGKIQERYGMTKAEAETQAEAWSRALKGTLHKSAGTIL
jgi:uncharacterized protein YjbJ (UPF0337 family)